MPIEQEEVRRALQPLNEACIKKYGRSLEANEVAALVTAGNQFIANRQDLARQDGWDRINDVDGLHNLITVGTALIENEWPATPGNIEAAYITNHDKLRLPSKPEAQPEIASVVASERFIQDPKTGMIGHPFATEQELFNEAPLPVLAKYLTDKYQQPVAPVRQSSTDDHIFPG